jgi:hypothetical protein
LVRYFDKGEMVDMLMEGGCLCGKIRYGVTNEPALVGVCHCDDCRKFGPRPHGSNLERRCRGGVIKQTDTRLQTTDPSPKLIYCLLSSAPE